MHANLKAILDMPSNQIDRVSKPLPTGWYIACVEGQPEEGEAKTGNTFYDFDMRIVDVYKDVDENELEEFLTNIDGSSRILTEIHLSNKYYVTRKSMGRFLQFLDHLEGLRPSDVGDQKAPVSRRIGEAVGKTCLIHVKHEPWQSGEGVSARVDQTMIYDEDE